MIGKEILNYRIVSLIGKGGMGTVYLAVHKLISKEQVAIKVINADMANDFTRNLLRDEAQHLAGLKHTNIVGFKNYHIDDAGNIYLIMEYADGKNLEDYIMNVNGLVVEDRICPLFEPILDAVGYAHRHKILHRDIKPANVVITTEGVPKILDFGIAKVLKQQGDEDGDNMVMGTPSYMSPEQVKGEHLDERSDIYSLGVLLHHILTGNPPYDTTTLTEHEINDKVIQEPLPRMRLFYKYVSEGVQKVVDKATAKDPNDRYQTCEEFKKDLHRTLNPWKMPMWMKCAAIGVLLLAIGGGLYAWDYNRIKTYYYKDYVERWGVPEGVGELSASEQEHAHRAYKFTYQKRKLLRVEHVNSLGYLIDDGESERNERPIDQIFSYTVDGLVNRVTVKDRSGKVLYVKGYESHNGKLNTMKFLYNDEHGTERVVSNKTVGYGRLLEQDGDERGRISRWWLEYDENGYLTTIKYAGIDNSQVSDNNGIYGRKYVRDEKGREVEIHYIGIDGEPQPTKWGLGIKKFYYDEKDNWVKAEYLTIDGQTAYDDTDGVAVYEMEHDEYGNVTYAMHLDGNGEGMYPKKHNVAGVNHIYDDKGFLTTTEYLDVDRNPMIVQGAGCAVIKEEYDERGYVVKRAFYDTDGNLVEVVQGNASLTLVNDECGNPVEGWYYNVTGDLVELEEGYAGFKAEYDSIGNQTKYLYYGIDKKPCAGSNGSYGQECEYDERNLVSKITWLGADMTPTPDNNNVAMAHYYYDRRGNTVKVSFYDTDGKSLRLSDEGCAGWNNIYDEHGNHVERSFFGVGGEPIMPNGLHYAKVKYTYDENGNQNSTRYYDLDGKLTLVDGVAGYDYINDRQGNTLESVPVGVNEKLAQGKLKTKYKYDKFGNEIEQSLFDVKGAALNYESVHKYVYSYNTRNQVEEIRYYGKDGKLTLSSDNKVAITKYEYDARGNRVKTNFYGTDNKSCKCEEGWSSSTYEHDAFGHVVKQCFFDIKGKPTDPKDMVPVGICQYDKRGNMIYLAAQDGNGKFIKIADDKWAISRMKYDKKNNRIEQSYYNEKDKPILCNEGYHKVKNKYNKSGKKIEEAHYGINDQPIAINNYHVATYSYDETSGRLKEQTYFDVNRNKINTSWGFHKCVFTYNEKGESEYRKYYKANGSLYATQRWNGSDWELVQKEYNWQEDARNIQTVLPYSFELSGLKLQSLTITSATACELRFTIPYTTGQLSTETLNQIKEGIRQFVNNLETSFKHRPYVTGNLYDKNGTKIFSYRK